MTPKVLKVWWSENFAKAGEKIAVNALTADAAGQILNFQIYEFRRKSKIVKEINVPVVHPEVKAKWKIAYKEIAAEFVLRSVGVVGKKEDFGISPN